MSSASSRSSKGKQEGSSWVSWSLDVTVGRENQWTGDHVKGEKISGLDRVRELEVNELTKITRGCIGPSKGHGSPERGGRWRGGLILLESQGRCLGCDRIVDRLGGVGGWCGDWESGDRWSWSNNLLVPYLCEL